MAPGTLSAVRLPLRLGWRWFRTRSRDRFIGFMALVSLVGIVLGVAALTLVMSVMNGFDAELSRRILGVIPHVQVRAREDPATRRALRRAPGVTGTAPLLEGRALLRGPARIQVVGLYAVDPERERQVSVLPSATVEGRFEALDPGGLILGAPLARYLGLAVGDPLTLVLPRVLPDGTGGGRLRPEFRRLRVRALFEVGAEPDYAVAVAHVDAFRGSLGNAERIRLTLADPFRLDRTLEALRELPGVEVVETWRDTHGTLFETVRLEKNLMFTVVLLIVAVAVFAIVSSQVLLVEEKQGEIAILRVLGLPRRRVAAGFFAHGMLAGGIGVILGLALGLVLSLQITAIVGFFEGLLGVRVLAGTYFDAVPSQVRGGDLLRIAGATLALVAVASLEPARRVAGRVPWEALRNG